MQYKQRDIMRYFINKKYLFLINLTFLLVSCGMESVRIVTPSMGGTFNVGDVYMTLETDHFFRGQIVSFYRPESDGQKTLYVSRLVGVAGDSLEIKDAYIYINNQKQERPEGFYTSYEIKSNGIVTDRFFKNMGIEDFYNTSEGYIVHAGQQSMEKLRKAEVIKSVDNITYPKGDNGMNELVFPNNPLFDWSLDNFGVLYIPKKGDKIAMDKLNAILYFSIIKNYEGHKNVTLENDKLFINEEEISSYTFKNDYFFLIGDSWHNSLDSRSFGLIPYYNLKNYFDLEQKL